MTRRHSTAMALALASVLAAIAAPALAQSQPDYARLQVGQTLPGGYLITQRYGAAGFLATRGNDLFYVRGNTITRLNPRYAIGPQIEDLDPRRRRYRDD